MSRTEVVLQGALTADGRLVLDEKPDLPPGRVTVTLQPIPVPTGDGERLSQVLERIWATRDAQGHRGRSMAQAVAEVRALREEWEGRHEATDEPGPTP
jgi:hypothetical protein